MAALNLDTEGFTREQIKRRMLRRAADLWGYAEADLDSFDPLVAMLIEACSVEFERVSTELGTVQVRLLDRLAQVLHAEPDVAQSAFGIAQVRPVDPQVTVATTVQLGARRTGDVQAGQTGSTDMYFSPVRASTVVDGAIRYMATTDAIYRLDEANQKTAVAQRQGNPAVLPYQSLWLGIELADEVVSLNGVSFFFDWTSEARSVDQYALVAQSTWMLEGQPLHIRSGYGMTGPAPEVLLDEVFDGLRKKEKQVERYYERQFITIETAPDLQAAGLQRRLYPPTIGQWFTERDLRAIKEPVWWIEVRIGYAVSDQLLTNATVGMNCFPVLNRRLHRITYRLQQTLNIVPLETNRNFMAIRDVRTSQNRVLTAIPLGNLTDLAASTYTVRYGISRFDERDARQTLVNLLDQLHDESASFAALGEDFLTAVLRELDQALARLEAKVEQKTRQRDTTPYLIIKSQQPGDTVFIEYWTCDGELANRLPAGSRMNPYADSSLRKEGCYLMTTTTGGRARLKESEKIGQYKRALLTRNRVVTLEDVRAVCQAELGAHLRSVRVERTFRVDTQPTNGFQRCIRVRLEPSPSSAYTPADWQEQADLLSIQLQEQSVAALPYQIEVTNH